MICKFFSSLFVWYDACIFILFIMISMKESSLHRLAMVLGICTVLGFLGWCKQDSPSAQSSSQADLQNPSSQTDTVYSQSSVGIQQQLQINNRCIWCGKCARIASDTFVMQWGRASVVSQEHIDESSVQQAIRGCPVSAIEVIEV